MTLGVGLGGVDDGMIVVVVVNSDAAVAVAVALVFVLRGRASLVAHGLPYSTAVITTYSPLRKVGLRFTR